MKYVNAVIKESLRKYPPAAAILHRKLTKPTKIGPYILPANTLCSVNIWQIHHNPKYWENPDQYDPERFLNGEKRHPFSWIPFSAAPRNWYVIYYHKSKFINHYINFCLKFSSGQVFSLLEQRVILSMFCKYSIFYYL